MKNKINEKVIVAIALLFIAGSSFASMQLPQIYSSKYINSSNGLLNSEYLLSGGDIAGITIGGTVGGIVGIPIIIYGGYKGYNRIRNAWRQYRSQFNNDSSSENSNFDSMLDDSSNHGLNTQEELLEENAQNNVDLYNDMDRDYNQEQWLNNPQFKKILNNMMQKKNLNAEQFNDESFENENQMYQEINECLFDSQEIKIAPKDAETIAKLLNDFDINSDYDFEVDNSNTILQSFNEDPSFLDNLAKFFGDCGDLAKSIPLDEDALSTSGASSTYYKDYSKGEILNYSIMNRFSSLNVETGNSGELTAFVTINNGKLYKRKANYYANFPSSVKYNALYLKENTICLGNITDTTGNNISGTSPSISFFGRDNLGDPLFLLTYIGENNQIYGMILEYGVKINTLISITNPEPFDWASANQSLCYVGQYNGTFYFIESHNGYGNNYSDQEWADLLSITDINNNPIFNNTPIEHLQYDKKEAIITSNGCCFIKSNSSSPIAYIEETVTTIPYIDQLNESAKSNIRLDTLKVNLSSNTITDISNTDYIDGGTNADIGFLGKDMNGNYGFVVTYDTSDNSERIESLVLSKNEQFDESTSTSVCNPFTNDGKIAKTVETGYQEAGEGININKNNYYFSWKIPNNGNVTEQPLQDIAYFGTTADNSTGVFQPICGNIENITFLALQDCQASQIMTNTGSDLSSYLLAGQQNSYATGNVYTVQCNEANGEIVSLDNNYASNTIISKNTGLFASTGNGQETIMFHCVGPAGQAYKASLIPVSIAGNSTTSTLDQFNPSITSFIPGNNYILTVNDANGFINAINGGFAIAQSGSTSQYNYYIEDNGNWDLSFISNCSLDPNNQNVTLNYSYPNEDVEQTSSNQLFSTLNPSDLNSSAPQSGEVIGETNGGSTSTVVQNATQGPTINGYPVYMGIATASSVYQNFDNSTPAQQLQDPEVAKYGGFTSLSLTQQTAYVEAANTIMIEEALINNDAEDFNLNNYLPYMSNNGISYKCYSNTFIRNGNNNSVTIAYNNKNIYPDNCFALPMFNISINNGSASNKFNVYSLTPTDNSSYRDLINSFAQGIKLDPYKITNSTSGEKADWYYINGYTLLIASNKSNNALGLEILQTENPPSSKNVQIVNDGIGDSSLKTSEQTVTSKTYAYIYYGGTYNLPINLQNGIVPTIDYTASNSNGNGVLGTFSISGSNTPICEIKNDGLYDMSGAKIYPLPVPATIAYIASGINSVQIAVPTTTSSILFQGNNFKTSPNFSGLNMLINLAYHPQQETIVEKG